MIKWQHSKGIRLRHISSFHPPSQGSSPLGAPVPPLADVFTDHDQTLGDWPTVRLCLFTLWAKVCTSELSCRSQGLGSREALDRTRGSCRCMRRSQRGFTAKVPHSEACWEEEWTGLSRLMSMIPFPARSQGSHTRSTLGTKWESQSSMTRVHLEKHFSILSGNGQTYDVFIKSPCLCFSMRKLGALGSAPCAHSSVPKGSAFIMWSDSGTATLPMVLKFLPHPRGNRRPG